MKLGIVRAAIRPCQMTPLALVGLSLAVNLAWAQPRLQVENPQPIVEVTSAGALVEKTVALVNLGDVPLDVEVARTSCGCTKAELSATHLEAGARGLLTMRMQMSGWGSKTESVTLKTNDPQQTLYVVRFQAKTPATVVPQPAQLVLDGHQGEELHRYLTVMLPNNATVAACSVNSPFLSVKTVEATKVRDGTMQKVQITLSASAPPGQYSNTVTLSLKDAPIPEISVPANTFVQPDIQFFPNQIFLGQVPRNSEARRTGILESRAGHAFAIKSISTSSPSLTADCNREISAAAHALQLNFKIEGQVGTLIQETVTVVTSTGSIVVIPVTGWVVAAGDSPNPNLVAGKPAPDFTVLDMDGKAWRLADLRTKKNLLLVFFPKCYTGGCTTQLSSLRDHQEEFEAAETQILAVSVDPAEGDHGQKAFAKQWNLKFPLIPDVSRALCLLYGATQTSTDLASRRTVLIDKQGVIRLIDDKVNVLSHGPDMLKQIRDLGLNR